MLQNKHDRVGRPNIEIDKDNFEKLCSLQCTLEEIAGFFNCSDDTIRRFCKRTYKEEFCEVYKKKSSKGKISLRRQQFKIAEGGNATMAIFLGKVYLGQKETKEIELKDNELIINVTPYNGDSKNEKKD